MPVVRRIKGLDEFPVYILAENLLFAEDFDCILCDRIRDG